MILALISYFIENRNLKRRLAELKEREENFLYFYTLKSLPTDNIPPNSLITNNNHIGIILDRKYSEKVNLLKILKKLKKLILLMITIYIITNMKSHTVIKTHLL